MNAPGPGPTPQPEAVPGSHPASRLAERAVELAAFLLKAAEIHATPRSRTQAKLLAGMMEDAEGKRFTIRLADEVLRLAAPARAARRLADLLDLLGAPRYLGVVQQALLRAGAAGARWLPALVMPLIAARIRSQSRGVILRAERGPLRRYLARRRARDMRVNLNVLGEAVLGEEEAERRLAAILEQLASPGVECVSAKLSALFSQVHLVGFEETVRQVKERLRRLYRVAQTSGGQGRPKLVTLDMEEYRDLELTVRSFREVLDEPEFERLEAGVVLQAYLPDSFGVQQELTGWARARLRRTGASIRLRLVKGANLAMEQVEAALRGWPQAPFETKREVDANFKRMLRFACRPENAAAVRIGVGSHNLFDIAYALLLREESEVEDRVEFEMLEGMAVPQAEAVRDRSGGLLLYAPVVKREHFSSAIAYLVRRLDENTAPSNFLADLFGLKVGDEAWNRQRRQFLEACELAGDPGLPVLARRTQNRLRESPAAGATAGFRNEPDTDFALPANRDWIEAALQRWESLAGIEVPLQVAGRERCPGAWGRGMDPSFAGREVYRFALGGPEEVAEAVLAARHAQPQWEALGIPGRAAVLRQAAAAFGRHRGDSVGCMVLDAGKAVLEADAEVSEAIDFANFYALALDGPGWTDGVRPAALGTVLITPPWNFPYAIPAGGCLAALMAGNAVILKPAPETVLTAWQLANHLWAAGVPREILQFLPVPDGETGRRLVTHEGVDAVVLTGAYETAQAFRRWKPALRLFGETSGKNMLIVTQAADLDLAIKDLVKSAFGHAGQKCSAASLALVERPVFESSGFRRALRDAVASLRTGSAWDRSAVVTPLIREPGNALRRALTKLDDGEEWLVQPHQVGDHPRLWSPGVRWGVRRGSWFARTECFGPVLGVLQVRDLDEAIEIQNEGEFGLTGGIHSLDEGEIQRWQQRAMVGNGYVNRSLTGAIVRRQPFGGWKHSSTGGMAKAGGPNYVAGFAQWRTVDHPRLRAPVKPRVRDLLRRLEDILPESSVWEAWRAAAGSDAWWWQREFGIAHDPSAVRGETNLFRYVPHQGLELRIEASRDCREEALVREAGRVMLAAACAGVPVHLSLDRPWPLLARMATLVSGGLMESAETLAVRLQREPRPVRWIGGGPIPARFRTMLNELNLPVFDDPPVENGRLELLTCFREQSLSSLCHRYGSLIVGA